MVDKLQRESEQHRHTVLLSLPCAHRINNLSFFSKPEEHLVIPGFWILQVKAGSSWGHWEGLVVGMGTVSGRTGYHFVSPLLDRTHLEWPGASVSTHIHTPTPKSEAHQGLGCGLLWYIVVQNRCFAKLGGKSSVTDILMDLDSGAPGWFSVVISPGGFGFRSLASHWPKIPKYTLW